MNYFELLLHVGPKEATTCEKTADCILLPARCLWQNREVVVINENLEATYDTPGCGDPFGCCAKRRPPNTPYPYCSPNLGIFAIYVANMAFIELPALLLASVGLPLKHYILSTNEEAAKYSRLVESLLLKEEFEARIAILENKIGQVSYTIPKVNPLNNVLTEETPVFQNYCLEKHMKRQKKLSALKLKLAECESNLNF
jgi:hypothetical protein